MKLKDTAIKEVKGFSSSYPNICNLKLLPNIDGTWITIQDNIGTSMTIKLSDLSDFICLNISNAIKEEPKTGRWILSGGYWRCSNCNQKTLLKLDKSKSGYREYAPIKSDYCPNCGAKMDVNEEDY